MKSLVPSTSDQIDRVLIDHVAAEIGTELLAYLERMYPKLVAAMDGGCCKIAIRNHIRNDVASAIKCRTVGEYEKWIADRRAHRREIRQLRKLGDIAETIRKQRGKEL